MENFKNFCKKVKWDSFIISILAIVIGILCVAMPERSADVICIIFGCSLIAIGVTLFIRFITFESIFGEHILIFAIIMVIFGIFCLVYPNLIKSMMTVLCGIYIIIDSASSLNDSIYLARADSKGWLLLFILSLVCIVLGVCVMFSTFDTVVIFAGISLIIEGVKRFALTLAYSKKIKEAKDYIRNNTNNIEIK